MLRATKKAVTSVDPQAKIVVGGLFGRSWESLQTLYDHGARGLFDVVAIHPMLRLQPNRCASRGWFVGSCGSMVMAQFRSL